MADPVRSLVSQIEEEIAVRQRKLADLRDLFPDYFSNMNGQGQVAPSTKDGQADVENWGQKPTPKYSIDEARPVHATIERVGKWNRPSPSEITHMDSTTVSRRVLELNADQWMTSGDVALLLAEMGKYPNYGRASSNVRNGLFRLRDQGELEEEKAPIGLGTRFVYRLKNANPVSGLEVSERPKLDVPEVNPDTEDQAKYYSYIEYLTEAGVVGGTKHPEWRLGEVLFNVLLDQKPIMAEMIRGSKLDPFQCYDKHNPTVERFLTWVERNWDLGERDLILTNPQLAPKSE